MPSAAPAAVANECRECCSFCDRVVHPAGCGGCPYLYSYDDEHTGSRYMGCLAKVFKVEIDVGLFGEAERTRHGFGAVKVTGTPRPQCLLSVERAYDGAGEPFACVNPDFLARPEPAAGAPDSFDLRDRL